MFFGSTAAKHIKVKMAAMIITSLFMLFSNSLGYCLKIDGDVNIMTEMELTYKQESYCYFYNAIKKS